MICRLLSKRTRGGVASAWWKVRILPAAAAAGAGVRAGDGVNSPFVDSHLHPPSPAVAPPRRAPTASSSSSVTRVRDALPSPSSAPRE